jgi:hypothetical protein
VLDEVVGPAWYSAWIEPAWTITGSSPASMVADVVQESNCLIKISSALLVPEEESAGRR